MGIRQWGQFMGLADLRSARANVSERSAERLDCGSVTVSRSPAFTLPANLVCECAALGRGVVASLAGAIAWLTVTAASAEGPLKFADSQFEPITWSQLAGWAADDHLAAFAAYQTSCQAMRRRR